jgi:hypothetical protein
MRRAGAGALLAAFALWAPAAAAAPADYRDGPVYARVTPIRVVLGNQFAERRWSLAPFETAALVDKRDGGRTWSQNEPDFTLQLAGLAPLGSDVFHAGSVSVTKLERGGLRIAMELSGPPGLSATRVAEAYPGVAGFRTQTILHPAAPLTLSGAALDQAAVGQASATANAFHAGTDWRTPDWQGPQLSVGNSEAGDYRTSRSGGPGQQVDAPGEWLSTSTGGRTLFMVTERNDLPSSRVLYDGSVASARVDYTRDIISLGPLEEQGHVENPLGMAGRQRLLQPGTAFALEPVFTGFGDHAGDDVWQFHSYLVDHRLAPYQHAVVFNSNGTDSNQRSTGSKDDMDFQTVQQVAPIARRLGIDTFVLDDGWQAISGDWQPDSPQYPEPRWDGSPDSKFRPRFPDATFDAVRQAIAPMRLGLWMSPTFFNPNSKIYKEHPEWVCQPIGQALATDNLLDPNGGSNEAGIVPWNRAAFPYVESRIRDAIDHWGVTYFKFDFMVWLDCAGQGDLYEYEDAFVQMIDRLQRDHPGVTFQIDDTNDYRLFPFASVSRGPVWFKNGSPSPDQLLHNLWILSPYIPGFSIGQSMLGSAALQRYPVATLMAAALPSHMTYFEELRSLPGPVIDEAAQWITFYKAHRDSFGGVLYPLLNDPLKDGWTALQSWDPSAGRGAVLAFRQSAGNDTQRVSLTNVPPGRSFDLFEAPTGAYAGTVTSAQLTNGIDVTLPSVNQAKVLLVEPAAPRP